MILKFQEILWHLFFPIQVENVKLTEFIFGNHIL